MQQDNAVGFPEPIAIVGIGCRLPGSVSDAASLWDLLRRRKTGIVEIPKDRWDIDAFYDPNPDAVARSVSKWAGFIDDIRSFDPSFFDLSPREAASMDPQQRILLQTVYEAIQDAGVPAARLSDVSTGVFVGVSISDYRAIQERRITNDEIYAGTGYALCIVANRISHRFNLTGPSYAVDTACSSSLVALDQACRNISDGACDIAIAAGVNVMADPTAFVAFSKAGMLSNTGRVSTFDARADGYVRGEGAGVVILKKLSQAIEDGDTITALIRSTCLNQDGRTTTMTAPSQAAQIAMLEKLCASANVAASQIGYVEAHGTGTPVGDPIEAGAIGRVLGMSRDDGPVYVGSIKPNIGHLESAAGISGLIKAALVVQHGEIPPNINFETPSPHIPFDALNIQVPVDTVPLPQANGSAFAIVNSFGFGGTNASALIEAYRSPAPSAGVAMQRTAKVPGPRRPGPAAVPISASSAGSLVDYAGRLVQSMAPGGQLADTPLDAVAIALGTRRDHMANRVVVLANERGELFDQLSAFRDGTDLPQAEGSVVPRTLTGQAQPARKTAFVFTGQGSQWWAMGRQLFGGDPDYRKAIEDFDGIFKDIAGWSVVDALMADEADSRLDDTTYTQPAIFAVQIGLAAVWKQWGIEPDVVIGHSIGEAAAAYVAGGLTLDGAARFLSKRGLIRDQLGARGAMAAIGMDADELTHLLPDDRTIAVAAYNSPGSVTITGDSEAIHGFVEDFRIQYPTILARILNVDTAWHSYQLDAGEQWFRDTVGEIEWKNPHTPWISTVTGVLECRFDIDYGWRNLREPVRYSEAIDFALDLGANTFVELGPHRTLAGPTAGCAAARNVPITMVHSLQRGENDFEAMAGAVASLYVSGCDVDWGARCDGLAGDVDLPRYSWSQEQFWKDSEESRRLMFETVVDPLLGLRQPGPVPEWWSEISLKANRYLGDHRLQGDAIFPGAGYINMILAAGRDMFGDVPLEIENTSISDALFISADDEILFQTVFDTERSRIRIFSRRRDGPVEWTLRAQGTLRRYEGPAPEPMPVRVDNDSVIEHDNDVLYRASDGEAFVTYGPAFQGVQRLRLTDTTTLADIEAPDPVRDSVVRYAAHPAILDSCLQISDPRITKEQIERKRMPDDPVYLPVGARRIRFFDRFPEHVTVQAAQSGHEGGVAAGDFVVKDGEGRVLFIMDGLMNQSLPASSRAGAEETVVPEMVVERFYPAPAAKRPDGIEPYGAWLVLADDGKLVDPFADELAARGCRVEIVREGSVSGDLADALTDCIATASDQAEGTLGVVFAWSLDQEKFNDAAAASRVADCAERHALALIALGQALDRLRDGENRPDIWIVTRNARTIPQDGKTTVAALIQAPLVGLARTLATECQEFHVRQIDLDVAALNAAGAMCDILMNERLETEILLREDSSFVPRLERRDILALPPKKITIDAGEPERNFVATMENPGVIDALELREVDAMDCGAEDVTVKVLAVGLNFRDIMAATGLLPRGAEADPAWRNLGLEFAGIVSAAGSAVTHLKPGDRVMGMARRCLQRMLTLPGRAVAKLPKNITLEGAATIPSAFATAHYALNHVGRIAQGDKVLIHVATGGVGLAAVQLAKLAGAEIFATAGTEKKRRYLRRLGVRHVMNSRDLSFADDVLEATGGKGVDVVLNSLPGAYIEKGLDILAPYGRFLEIGKRDVYADSAIGLKALRKNITFSVLDLAALGLERPQLMSQLLGELVALFAERKLEPLPTTVFPVTRVADGFRYMSQAKHIGKVVISLDQQQIQVSESRLKPFRLSADASYLVTGASRGFGVSVADWMSRCGAGTVVLASRSGEIADDAQAVIDGMRNRGTEVEVVPLDVTDGTAVKAAVARLAEGNRPLKGIVHGAAVIDDGFLAQLDRDQVARVMRPKIAGAWNLHRALAAAKTEVDFFVSMSSIAQVLGSAGQANYVAANAFLDAFAQYRSDRGQAGQTVDWGALGDAGFVARSEAMASYLESIGLVPLSDDDAFEGLQNIMRTQSVSLLYASVDWTKVGRANPILAAAPRMAPMMAPIGGAATQIRIQIASASPEQRPELLGRFLCGEIGKVLKIDADAVPVDRPMTELGLDSLSSFELKNRIEGELGLALPISKFLQAPTVSELAQVVGELLEEDLAAESMASQAEPEAAASAQSQMPGREIEVSDRAHGLIALARARMTTSHATGELEHEIRVPLDPPVSSKKLQQALGKLARRHFAIRLTLDAAVVPTFVCGPVPVVQVLDAAEGLIDRPLQLESGELFRVCFAANGGGDAFASMRAHSAIADAWSMGVLADELLRIARDQQVDRPAGRNAFRKAMSRRRFVEDRAQSIAGRAFFAEALAPWPKALEFKRRGRAVAPVGMGCNRGPSREVTGRLHADAALQANEAERRALVMSAFAAALSRLTGQPDLVVCRFADGRDTPVEKRIVGQLCDELPVPFRNAGATPLAILAGRVERHLDFAERHRGFDVSECEKHFLKDLRACGAAPRQVGFSYLNADRLPVFPQLEGQTVDGDAHRLPTVPRIYDLLLEADDCPDGTGLRLIFDVDVLDEDTAAQIIKDTLDGLIEHSSGFKPTAAPIIVVPDSRSNKPPGANGGIPHVADEGSDPLPVRSNGPMMKARAQHRPVTATQPVIGWQAFVLNGLHNSSATSHFAKFWHLNQALRIQPGLDAGRTRNAFDKLVGRHEALRTRFVRDEGGWRAVVDTDHASGLQVHDLGPVSDERLMDAVRGTAAREFDVELGPLFDLHLFKCGPNGDVLLMRHHHLIMDGWSVIVLIDEFFKLIMGVPLLGRRPLRLAGFVEQHVNGKTAEQKHACDGYWKDLLLPAFDRPDIGRVAKGRKPNLWAIDLAPTCKLTATLDPDIANRIEETGRRLGVTSSALHMSEFARILSNRSGVDGLFLNTANANRGAPRLQNYVGWPMLMTQIRCDVSELGSRDALARSVHEQIRRGFEHADFDTCIYGSPLDKLVHEDGGYLRQFLCGPYLPDAIMRKSALAGALFGLPGSPLQSGSIKTTPLPLDLTPTTCLELSLRTHRHVGGLDLSVCYDTLAFARDEAMQILHETVERLGGRRVHDDDVRSLGPIGVDRHEAPHAGVAGPVSNRESEAAGVRTLAGE